MAYKTFVNGFPLNASEINNNLMNQAISTFADASARTTAISAPVEGQVTYLESDETYYKFDGTSWVALTGMNNQVSQAISGNYIINGAFDIWQRGASFPSLANGAFSADRWKYQASGATCTITQESLTPADITAIGYGEGQYYLSLEATVANDNAGITHAIEDVRSLAGQTVTLSFWAKSDATTLKTNIFQFFGSGGSSSATIGVLEFTPTTSWVRYTRTFTMPSISGKTIGTGSAVIIEISNPNSELFTLDIWGVQLEAGSVATPFKRHAPSLQGELAACQRYFYRATVAAEGAGNIENVCQGQAYTGTNAVYIMRLPVEMRTTPSLTVSSASHFISTTASFGNALCTSLSLSGQSTRRTVRLDSAISSGFAAGNITTLVSNNASGTLDLSAEL